MRRLLLVVATATLMLAGACTSKPDPSSAQAACDSMKDASESSATAWYQGRKAAGNSYEQMQSILKEASSRCPATIKPLIFSIARQMEQDAINSLPTAPVQ